MLCTIRSTGSREQEGEREWKNCSPEGVCCVSANPINFTWTRRFWPNALTINVALTISFRLAFFRTRCFFFFCRVSFFGIEKFKTWKPFAHIPLCIRTQKWNALCSYYCLLLNASFFFRRIFCCSKCRFCWCCFVRVKLPFYCSSAQLEKPQATFASRNLSYTGWKVSTKMFMALFYFFSLALFRFGGWISCNSFSHNFLFITASLTSQHSFFIFRCNTLHYIFCVFASISMRLRHLNTFHCITALKVWIATPEKKRETETRNKDLVYTFTYFFGVRQWTEEKRCSEWAKKKAREREKEYAKSGFWWVSFAFFRHEKLR